MILLTFFAIGYVEGQSAIWITDKKVVQKNSSDNCECFIVFKQGSKEWNEKVFCQDMDTYHIGWRVIRS